MPYAIFRHFHYFHYATIRYFRHAIFDALIITPPFFTLPPLFAPSLP
jgi:hypothetical protein